MMNNRIILIIGLLFGIILLAGCTQQPTVPAGKYTELAKCITAKGVKEYGAFWCTHCAKVKASFGDAFQYIDYTECDPKGTNANPEACVENNVEAYATFIFPDGSRLVGEPTPEQIGAKTGCPLPEGTGSA